MNLFEEEIYNKHIIYEILKDKVFEQVRKNIYLLSTNTDFNVCLLNNQVKIAMNQIIKEINNVLDLSFVNQAIANPLCDEKCEQLHVTSCNIKALITFVNNFRKLFKLYFAVHFTPILLFKLKKFKKNPTHELTKFIKALFFSLFFAAGTIAITRRVTCLFTKYFSFNWTCVAYSAIFSGVMLFFQSPSRQIELSLYFVAKGWQAGYQILKRRKYLIRMKCGNLVINGFALAVICFHFLAQPQLFRQSYKSVIGRILNDV